MAEGFKLTPAQEAYYDKLKTRDKFEDILSEAICEVITADAEDPIEGMIQALQKHRRQYPPPPPTPPPPPPSMWTTEMVKNILAKARELDKEAQKRAAREREDAQKPQAGPGHTGAGPMDDEAALEVGEAAREAEWKMIRWLQQLKVHTIVSDILEGAAAKEQTAEEGKQHGTSESGIEYVTHLKELEVGVKERKTNPWVTSATTLNSRMNPFVRSSAGLGEASRGRPLHSSPGNYSLQRDQGACEPYLGAGSEQR